MAILKNDKDKEKRPRVLLVPPPDLPVPAVQGGAVETLLTHLIRENERQGKLDLLCASVPDDAARRAAEQHDDVAGLHVLDKVLVDVLHAVGGQLFGVLGVQVAGGDDDVGIDVVRVFENVSFRVHDSAPPLKRCAGR